MDISNLTKEEKIELLKSLLLSDDLDIAICGAYGSVGQIHNIEISETEDCFGINVGTILIISNISSG